MSRKVLFLCTGNYYRSRFAEILFNHLAPSHQPEWRAFSRGLAIELVADDAGPISPFTVNGLAERGIPLAEEMRGPLALREEDLAGAQHVVALKQDEHLPLMKRNFPDWVERTEFWHVHDLDMATPQHALPQIEQAVHGLLKRLAG